MIDRLVHQSRAHRTAKLVFFLLLYLDQKIKMGYLRMSGRAEECTKRDPVRRQVANVGRLGVIPQIAR